MLRVGTNTDLGHPTALETDIGAKQSLYQQLVSGKLLSVTFTDPTNDYSSTGQPVSSLTLHKAIGQMDLEEVKKILLME